MENSDNIVYKDRKLSDIDCSYFIDVYSLLKAKKY